MKTVTSNARLARVACSTLALGLAPACLPQNLAQPDPGAMHASCLPGERGYLRASLRGEVDADLDWRGAPLQCEGGARPDGRGLRVSFLGPKDASGHRLRVVFGIAAPPGTARAAAVPTNVTVIVEGEQRLYTTRGDERCSIETVVQEPLPLQDAGVSSPATRDYRIAARGSCIDPATTLDGSGRLYINRFDFAGVARFEDNELHAATRS